MILITIKNVAHLTIGMKFNVSFMRNNSFYEKVLKFFNFSHRFCSNYKLENTNIFHFSSSIWSESFNCSN